MNKSTLRAIVLITIIMLYSGIGLFVIAEFMKKNAELQNTITEITHLNAKQNAVAQYISMQVNDSFRPAISGRGYVLGYLPVGHNMTWYGFGCDDSLNCTSGEVDIIDADGVHMTVINGMVVDEYYGG